MDGVVIKASRPWRLGILAGLVVLEGILAVYIRSPERVPLGFLSRSGKEYRVVWREPGEGIVERNFSALSGAIQFAEDTLNLRVGRNPKLDWELEYLDLQDRYGAYVLLWKMFEINFLFQMTFQNHKDALYFAKAFREGSYSPSPVGHSILLLPINTPKAAEH